MNRYDPGLEETIIVDAQDYFEQVLDAINSAQDNILLESYIFDDDYIGQAIAEALENAALRGLKVRILVDGVGACANFDQIAKQLITCGAEVKVYRPLPWRFELWPLSLVPAKGIFKLWHLLSYINNRDHRKLIIIDRKLIFLGSFNISQTHLPEKLGGKEFSDTAIRISGVDTQNILMAFDACWSKNSRRKTAHQLSKSPFLYNFTRHLRRKKRASLLKRIETASSTVWISNAYFIPDSELLEALISASHKGLDVRILLPGRSDVVFIPWASSHFFGSLLASGIRIYEYGGGVLHAKTIIIDDWACIGSSNLNTRSLMHDLELDYRLQLDKSREQLALNFHDDLGKSTELKPEGPNERPFGQRLLGRLLLIFFSYWV